MTPWPHRRQVILGTLIGGVWVFHGLWSKLLEGIPRHPLIVARIVGDQWAAAATLTIGFCEILLGIWVFSRRLRLACAVVQTVVLVAMNTLEIALARDLLISAPGMVALNLALLFLIWRWALAIPPTPPRG